MLVTQLTPKGKSKTIVEIDYDLTVVLSNKDLILYDVRKNEELGDGVWEELLAGLRSDVLRKCGSLLKDMDYTEQGLSQRLQHNGYPDCIVQEAVAKMREAGFLDDRKYAERYLQYHMQDRSRLRMRAELREKGVPGAVLEEVYSAWETAYSEEIDEAEVRQIRALMNKRGYPSGDADPMQEQKMILFLRNRGYAYDIIRAAMDGG